MCVYIFLLEVKTNEKFSCSELAELHTDLEHFSCAVMISSSLSTDTAREPQLTAVFQQFLPKALISRQL